MKRLGTSQGCCHGLDGSAHNIVIRVIGRETDTGSLTVGPQHQGTCIFRCEFFLHEYGPKQAGRP